MLHLALHIAGYMTSPVRVIEADADLVEAERRLRRLRVSSLAVVECGALVAVLSLTDLLRVGTTAEDVPGAPAGPLLTLPEMRVRDALHPSPLRDVLHPAPLCVGVAETISVAAHLMLQHHVHRVFVVEERRPVGVLGTRGVVRAVRDSRSRRAISCAMSTPVMTLSPDVPARAALQRLGRAHVRDLLIVENGWPVGLFGQADALAARASPADTPVGQLLSAAFLCLPPETPACHAAAQLSATRARAIVVVADGEVQGILTGIDMAALAI